MQEETRILVVLPKSSKVSLYYSRESLEANTFSKTLKRKEWMQDGKEKER
jgi:hypothetical protein